MTNLNRMRSLLATTGILSALWGASAIAAVPTSATIEGLLLSAGGGPAADGTYTATFSIYAAEAGGSPVWTESGVSVTAKGGQFTYMLGSKTPLSAAAVNLQTAYMGMQIGSDPELPRKPVGASLFALRAAVAEALECSGCLKAGVLDPGVLQPYAKTTDLSAYAKSSDLSAYAKSSDLSAYAKSTDLSAYAKSSDLGAYAKSTDLSAYVKAASLATVAGTGSYTDLTNLPTLAKVASTGDYADLKNQPAIPQAGKLCGTGLFLKGFNADGSINCVALKETDLPADGINEVSNGLIHNQFVDSTAGTANVKIPDGLGAGTTDSLTFPDIGVAQKIWVNMTIANSNLSGVRVELYGPGISTPYVLYDGGKTGTTLTASFNDTTAIVSGDLSGDWVGKNIKGAWSITVKDLKAGGGSGGFDGTFNWSVNIQTLSSKKVQVKGDAIVTGNLTVGGSVDVGSDTGACDGTKKGALRLDSTYGLETCNGTDWVAAMPRKPMFSGGCQSHSSGGGEDTYCLNGIDFNTMDKYATFAANGIVTIKVDGYYRVNVYMDGITTSYRRMMFRRTPVGGSEVDFAYAHLYEQAGGWHFISLDTTWPFKKGDTFRIVGQNDTGNYRWHSWNIYGQHSRAQISFEGPLTN
ncbi:MAG: hypothetical protein HY902_00980 [Deltaproteobacteria bacterium]|nr:hypothetical protein [Deltaproteobacteria bacterium]